MSQPKRTRIIASVGLIVIILATFVLLFSGSTAQSDDPWAAIVKHRTHLDHVPFSIKISRNPGRLRPGQKPAS